MKTIKIVLQRILFFLPFICFAFIGAFIIFIQWVLNFIQYGGETITYTDKMNRKTIEDIFNKLEQLELNNKK